MNPRALHGPMARQAFINQETVNRIHREEKMKIDYVRQSHCNEIDVWRSKEEVC